jgi:ESS family glutamate:Na+ symporter
VPCLIVGMIIASLQPRGLPGLPVAAGTPVLALILELSLSVLLAMSLMNMQLWILAGMAGPQSERPHGS